MRQNFDVDCDKSSVEMRKITEQRRKTMLSELTVTREGMSIIANDAWRLAAYFKLPPLRFPADNGR